jgi:hypothetical protein
MHNRYIASVFTMTNKEKALMKDTIRQLTLSVSQIDRRLLQVVLLVVVLTLFVLGAGAPVTGGGPGINSLPIY